MSPTFNQQQSLYAIRFNVLFRILFLLAGFLLCSMTYAAPGTNHVQQAAENRFRFEIGPRELGEVLEQYSHITGLAVMIDSHHARVLSGAVNGFYTAPEALQQLLKGTALQARHIDMQSIVIEAISAPSVALVERPLPADISDATTRHSDAMHFITKIHGLILKTLCRMPEAIPGTYRMAVQIGFDARGKAVNPYLLDTTGIVKRDVAILGALRGIDAAQSPPPSMAQPISLLLLPDTATLKTDCTAFSHQGDGVQQTEGVK